MVCVQKMGGKSLELQRVGGRRGSNDSGGSGTPTSAPGRMSAGGAKQGSREPPSARSEGASTPTSSSRWDAAPPGFNASTGEWTEVGSKLSGAKGSRNQGGTRSAPTTPTGRNRDRKGSRDGKGKGKGKGKREPLPPPPNKEDIPEVEDDDEEEVPEPTFELGSCECTTVHAEIMDCPPTRWP